MDTKEDRITSSLDEEAIVYTEYADALIGVDSKGRATYNLEKCINILIERDGMDSSLTQARQKLMSSGKMRTSALCLNEFILNILSIKLKKVKI